MLLQAQHPIPGILRILRPLRPLQPLLGRRERGGRARFTLLRGEREQARRLRENAADSGLPGRQRRHLRNPQRLPPLLLLPLPRRRRVRARPPLARRGAFPSGGLHLSEGRVS